MSESIVGEERSQERVVLKDAVPCRSESACTIAPRGEYAVERGVASIGLCSCANANRFTLSFDSFLQHLNEGRIGLIRS